MFSSYTRGLTHVCKLECIGTSHGSTFSLEPAGNHLLTQAMLLSEHGGTGRIVRALCIFFI